MTDSAIITYLGHTSFLIELGEDRVVIDPILRRRLLLWQRRDEPVFDFQKLWQTQTVVLTNPRFDRLDPHSLKYFKQKSTALLCPESTHGFLKKFFHFELLDMAEDHPKTSGVFNIIPFPTPHTFWRFFKRHEKSWHLIIKTAGQTLFYASDTGFDNNLFADIAARHPIDVAILPIGNFDLPFTNKTVFLNPETAARTALEIKAKRVIPCRFGAFPGFSKNDHLLEQFQNQMQQHGLAERVTVLNPGEHLTLNAPTQSVTHLTDYKVSDNRRKT